MKSLSYGLAACLLLAIVTQARADEPLVDLAPPGTCHNGVCVATPTEGGCTGGVCRRSVASAVATAGRAPATVVRRVAARIGRRPLLRRLFSRRRQVGSCRR